MSLLLQALSWYNSREYQARLQTARDLLSRSIPSYGERLGGAEIVVAADAYASLTLHVLGRLEAGHAAVLAGVVRARELDDPFTLAWALFSRSRGYGIVGDWDAALADAEESLTIARHYGFSAFIARSLECRGRARAGLGALTAAIEDCREALALWGRSGVVHTTPYTAANLADRLVQAGRLGEARKVFDDIELLVAGTDEAVLLGECQRVRGLIAVDEADLSGATDWFHKPIETSRNQAARFYELRAATAWAEVVMRHGGPTDAHRALTDVYRRFTEGHRAADLQRAKAILNRMSGVGGSSGVQRRGGEG